MNPECACGRGPALRRMCPATGEVCKTCCDQCSSDCERTEAAAERKNPEILCACGCGATLRRFDDHGRSRRFLSGHNSRLMPSSHARILGYLREHGPSKRGDIASGLKMLADDLDGPLGKLRDRGLLTQPRWGYWAAVDGPDPEPRPADLVELAELAACWARGAVDDAALRRAANEICGPPIACGGTGEIHRRARDRREAAERRLSAFVDELGPDPDREPSAGKRDGGSL